MTELVRAGVNVNANAYRGTPLLWAIYADRSKAATWLLDHGADPDLRARGSGSLLLARTTDTGIEPCSTGMIAPWNR